MTDSAEERKQRLLNAYETTEQTIYFNGFVNALGIGDVSIILELNNKSVAVLNTSYTVAKTLAEKLGGLIKNLEEASGQEIMTTDNVSAFLRTRQGSQTVLKKKKATPRKKTVN
jgi:hypothetical protein